MKKTIQKGFTLIELMIVIVILGVLMSTVLPKLTGAQARARDTGRVADLGNISQALITLYSDTGSYPGTNGTVECLNNAERSQTAGATAIAMAALLKGGKVPMDMQIKNEIGTISSYKCDGTAAGDYLYMPITKNSINKNGFILCANVETLTKANTDGSKFDATSLGSFEVATNVTYKFGGDTLAAEPAGGAKNSLYCIVE